MGLGNLRGLKARPGGVILPSILKTKIIEYCIHLQVQMCTYHGLDSCSGHVKDSIMYLWKIRSYPGQTRYSTRDIPHNYVYWEDWTTCSLAEFNGEIIVYLSWRTENEEWTNYPQAKNWCNEISLQMFVFGKNILFIWLFPAMHKDQWLKCRIRNWYNF